jgi:hypothetical protein
MKPTSETREQRIDRLVSAIVALAGEDPADVAEAVRVMLFHPEGVIRAAVLALLFPNYTKSKSPPMAEAFSFIDRDDRPSMRVSYRDADGFQRMGYVERANHRLVAEIVRRLAASLDADRRDREGAMSALGRPGCRECGRANPFHTWSARDEMTMLPTSDVYPHPTALALCRLCFEKARDSKVEWR